MNVFLIGANSEILNSFTQHIHEHEVKIDSNIWALMNRAGQFRTHHSFLVVFDINDAPTNFNKEVQLLRSKFPQITIWAIFDSESNSLNKELSQMGFEKIISYHDDPLKLISEFEQHR